MKTITIRVGAARGQGKSLLLRYIYNQLKMDCGDKSFFVEEGERYHDSESMTVALSDAAFDRIVASVKLAEKAK